MSDTNTNKPPATEGCAPETGSVALDHVLLCIDGWHGRSEHMVQLVEIRGAKCLIRAITDTPFAGRCKWLEAGKTALVPSYALRMKPLNIKAEG